MSTYFVRQSRINRYLVMLGQICRDYMFRQVVILKHVEAFKTAIENKIGKVIDAYYILVNYDDIYP
jgi:hypothetical protein